LQRDIWPIFFNNSSPTQKNKKREPRQSLAAVKKATTNYPYTKNTYQHTKTNMSDPQVKEYVSTDEESDYQPRSRSRTRRSRNRQRGGGQPQKQQSQALSTLPEVGQVTDTVKGATDTVSGLAKGVTGLAGGGGEGGSKKDTLRLRLDLNLDVEITLKARIHGDLTLALLQ
jgi:hypothetical protein